MPNSVVAFYVVMGSILTIGCTPQEAFARDDSPFSSDVPPATAPIVELGPGPPLVERFTPVGTGRIRTLVKGPPSGTPVLLLHGATFRAEVWRDAGTIDKLASLGFYVLAADLPGHGKSKRTGHQQRDFLAALIEALDIVRPVVVAHSWAGAYTFPLIVSSPRSLRAAVLVAPAKMNRYIQKLKGNPLPVLVLWGKADKLISYRRATRLAALFQTSEVEVFAEAGHECYRDAPELFHRALSQFLLGLENSTAHGRTNLTNEARAARSFRGQ